MATEEKDLVYRDLARYQTLLGGAATIQPFAHSMPDGSPYRFLRVAGMRRVFPHPAPCSDHEQPIPYSIPGRLYMHADMTCAEATRNDWPSLLWFINFREERRPRVWPNPCLWCYLTGSRCGLPDISVKLGALDAAQLTQLEIIPCGPFPRKLGNHSGLVAKHKAPVSRTTGTATTAEAPAAVLEAPTPAAQLTTPLLPPALVNAPPPQAATAVAITATGTQAKTQPPLTSAPAAKRRRSASPPYSSDAKVARVAQSDQLAAVRTKVAQLEGALAALGADLARVQADNTALRADGAALRADNAALRADNATLGTKVATLDDAQTGLRGEVKQVAVDGAELKAAVAEVRADNAALATKVDTLAAAQSGLQGAMKKVTDEGAELKAAVAEVANGVAAMKDTPPPQPTVDASTTFRLTNLETQVQALVSAPSRR